MARISKIEWTDRSDWNPMRGCTRVSEGCRNCYAEAIAARFSGPGQPFEGFAEKTANGPRWTGKVEIIQKRLTLPLKWRKPQRIFVNSAFDLFHENVPDEWIDKVFAVMALAPRHTFQILTKRSARMQEYMAGASRRSKDEAVTLLGGDVFELHQRVEFAFRQWPLPNVWLGVSIEDQKTADERIPHLLATPAAIRWISAEPLLGRVDLTKVKTGQRRVQLVPDSLNSLTGESLNGHGEYEGMSTITRAANLNWVVCGGESGKGARPMHPDWVRAIRDDCKEAGTAFFFKQWGEWFPRSQWEGNPDLPLPDDECIGWPDSQNLKHFEKDFESELFHRVGKKAAGRSLDCKTHNELPEVT